MIIVVPKTACAVYFLLFAGDERSGTCRRYHLIFMASPFRHASSQSFLPTINRFKYRSSSNKDFDTTTLLL
jgi:hypothetical protein